MRRLLLCFAALAAGSVAMADPIVYQNSPIPANGTVAGVNNQAPGNPATTAGAGFHSFYAIAGSPITVFADRQAGFFDPAMGVWSGLYADTNDLSFFDANFIDFGDDNDVPNIPGPFGDPRVNFIAPVTGFYTVAVTNFGSDAGGPPNPYTLTVQGNANVPEPVSMAIFGGLVAVGGVVARRRMTKVRA